jgi:hypothetical protein
MIRELSFASKHQESTQPCAICEHRSVAADGRIVCRKIMWGENRVSPALCRSCPSQAVNCTHLRFSLRHTSPSPLVVRFNGRTEVWNDAPPALQFEQAACALQVAPLSSPRACAGCALRQPAAAPAPEPAPVARPGQVVPFVEREREAAAAAG